MDTFTDPPVNAKCYKCGGSAVVQHVLDPKQHAGISNFCYCAEHAVEHGYEVPAPSRKRK